MSEDRKSILYLDDQVQNLTVLAAALEDDYEVHVATSAWEAMKILQRQDIQVVIADQRMPYVTGIEFLGQVLEQHPDAIRPNFRPRWPG